MKLKRLSFAILAVAAGCAGLWQAAAAAGSVEVKFLEPAKFSDIGWQSLDRERHLKQIESHVQELAKQLPDGQVLRLEFTDIDLAGEQRPLWRRHVWDVRVITGRADWPHMTLRYALNGADGKTLQAGEERISDMAYTMRSLRGSEQSEELGYDKRLLTQWFSQRFTAAGARQ